MRLALTIVAAGFGGFLCNSLAEALDVSTDKAIPIMILAYTWGRLVMPLLDEDKP